MSVLVDKNSILFQNLGLHQRLSHLEKNPRLSRVCEDSFHHLHFFQFIRYYLRFLGGWLLEANARSISELSGQCFWLPFFAQNIPLFTVAEQQEPAILPRSFTIYNKPLIEKMKNYKLTYLGISNLNMD